MCKSADLLLMVLDASKPHAHRKILTAELEAVGIRLNRRPPSIYFKKKKTGGISFNATVPLSRMDEKLCQRILQVRLASQTTLQPAGMNIPLLLLMQEDVPGRTADLHGSLQYCCGRHAPFMICVAGKPACGCK